MVSPHTRGWTCCAQASRTDGHGFPAHAGMDPACARPASRRCRFPRTRGDGPCRSCARVRPLWVSPHTRGWTPVLLTPHFAVVGFPAHAGMDPACARPASRPCRFPRTRGDGPVGYASVGVLLAVSPHTRGWTQRSGVTQPQGIGFPAHAGMDPAPSCVPPHQGRFPRTRGDGPLEAVRPPPVLEVSPHTRGWTAALGDGGRLPAGFPAHAGMDLRESGRPDRAWRFPRTRGDGPWSPGVTPAHTEVSPHTRGWTCTTLCILAPSGGFPAHAGMDPCRRSRTWIRAWFPRTRGDGPPTIYDGDLVVMVSPHTRGWTRGLRRLRRRRGGFPAHAGMDPTT